MTEKKVIHKDMTIEEILNSFPFKAQKLAQEITNAGLHCVGCHAATWETLEVGMLGHGKSPQDIDNLLRRLNALMDEKVEKDTITITQRAADKFSSFLKEEGKDGWGLRFGDQLAGCSGYEYVLEYSEKHDPKEDEVFHSYGVQIHVRKDTLPRLLGCEIDYVDALQGGGFKISNPNVKGCCGCGSSHGY